MVNDNLFFGSVECLDELTQIIIHLGKALLIKILNYCLGKG